MLAGDGDNAYWMRVAAEWLQLNSSYNCRGGKVFKKGEIVFLMINTAEKMRCTIRYPEVGYLKAEIISCYLFKCFLSDFYFRGLTFNNEFWACRCIV